MTTKEFLEFFKHLNDPDVDGQHRGPRNVISRVMEYNETFFEKQSQQSPQESNKKGNDPENLIFQDS